MTPAANPIIISSNFRLTLVKKKTTADPRMVHPQVKRPAKKAKKTTFCVIIQFIINKSHFTIGVKEKPSKNTRFEINKFVSLIILLSEQT